MAKQSPINIQQMQVLRYFRSTIILALVALLLVAISLLVTIRVQKIEGTEVGVKVNNVSGSIEVIDRPGAHIYNGILSTFHVLDKRVQTLEMVADTRRGDRKQRDDLRVKTIDGSDVFLDLTITYRIRPDKVEEVAKRSGLEEAYKFKWVRDYSRSVCRSIYGELTTEQFYDATLRSVKAMDAKEELNRQL